MNFIQGKYRNQFVMFLKIMDDYISEDNPVRVIDAYVSHLFFFSITKKIEHNIEKR